jgi:hypothetical protein
MKRGTPRHPKMIRLIQDLGLKPKDRATAVGHLELLWHFTAEFAPRGDIGRYADDQIEGACEWYGKRGKLVQALTTSGWVDQDSEHRLIVHDWADHADGTVKKKLERADQWFLVVTGKVELQKKPQPLIVEDNGCLARGKDKASLVSSRKEEESLTRAGLVLEPTVGQASGNGSDAIAAVAQRMHDRHPAARRCGAKEAARAIAKILAKIPKPDRVAKLAEIEDRHARWCASEAWTKDGGEYSKALHNWLAPTMGRFDEDPPDTGTVVHSEPRLMFE